MTDPTDERLLELANTTGLLATIRLAAACHPDRISTQESTAPANAALLRFARAVLAEEAEERDPHPYDEILDLYDALAAQHSGCVYHGPNQ